MPGPGFGTRLRLPRAGAKELALSLGVIVAESVWKSRDNSAVQLERNGARISPMLKDFKAFIMRGNVLDLAVAVIIGGAFGAIVTSAVNDVIMPPIGLVLGRVDFKDLFVSLRGQSFATLAAAKAAGVPVIAYGQFLNTVVNFLIIA